MKLQDVTPESIADISNSELCNLHLRIHQLWGQRKYKKMNIKALKAAHPLVVSQMKDRGLNHTEHAMKRVMSKLTTYLEGID